MATPAEPAPMKPFSGFSKKTVAAGDGDLVGQVPAHGALAGFRIIGLADPREQQQPGIVQRPGRQKDEVGGLKESPRLCESM